ncbi:MAG: DUF2141 domain-containing protein [Gammaproteobacteria bacterium]
MRIVCATLLGLALCAGARAGDLTIEIDGVTSAQGQLMVTLYRDAGTYLKSGRQQAGPAVAGRAVLVIKDVAPGEYAFALYHDANGNGKLDANLIGIPTEAYAFSNDAKAVMGPPAFDAARFAVPAEGRTLRVAMQ